MTPPPDTGTAAFDAVAARSRAVERVEEALAFDDVLVMPAYSQVLPSATDIRTRLTRTIALHIPLVSSAMDTVTETAMAIAMAQHGGIGVIHKNLSIEDHAAQVRAVKKYESGMVINPVTIHPDQTLADARALMDRYSISGIPVVERGERAGEPGRLVGILTNRDVRFATDPAVRVYELMTRENLVTVAGGVGPDEARRLLHRHRIEKLLVVDEAYRCVGLITVKDMDKAQAHPFANKDELGRLRVAAATGTGEDGLARASALIDAEADVIVVDTAHGHSAGVLAMVERIKHRSNSVQVIAGNVATPEAAAALVAAGADAVKIGIGPGSICTTRIVAGVGVPQFSAVLETAAACREAGVPAIADGGIRTSGDIVKAIGAGADCVMVGSLLGGHRRGAGRGVSLSGPQLQILSRHGQHRCDGARLGRSLFPAGGARQSEAGAGRDRGQGRLQGAGRGRLASARGRPARRHGLYRQRRHRTFADPGAVPPHHRGRPAREPCA